MVYARSEWRQFTVCGPRVHLFLCSSISCFYRRSADQYHDYICNIFDYRHVRHICLCCPVRKTSTDHCYSVPRCFARSACGRSRPCWYWPWATVFTCFWATVGNASVDVDGYVSNKAFFEIFLIVSVPGFTVLGPDRKTGSSRESSEESWYHPAV